jgi:hypothetical protein
MPKPNYGHQKKQREEAAHKKREEKQLRRQQRKSDAPAGTPSPPDVAERGSKSMVPDHDHHVVSISAADRAQLRGPLAFD